MLRRPLVVVVVCALAAALGCGASGRGSGGGGGRPSATACAREDAAEAGAIARRIYAQAARGRNVVAARRRLARSARLAAAVQGGSPSRTAAALRPLLRHQITRIAIWSFDGRPLARYGTSAAPAPVAGTIVDALGLPVGRYVLSVSSDAALAGELAAVTGARARVGAATSAPADAPGVAPAPAPTPAPVAFAATAFPAGALSVALDLPPTLTRACGPTAAATRMAVIAGVGRRLLASEAGGLQARRVLRHVATDRGFRAAVAARDPVALRAAIVRFFRTRSLHVVRIRATGADGHLIGDVGGPFVLEPISGPVRDAQGHHVGRVTLSVQDDSGYVKLLHRFTGASVALLRAGRTIPESNRLPAHPLQHTTLTATAFPSGPLRVVVALP